MFLQSSLRFRLFAALVAVLIWGCSGTERSKPVAADQAAEVEQLLQRRTAMTAEHWDDTSKALDAAEKLSASREFQPRLAEMRLELATAVRLEETRQAWPTDAASAERDPVIKEYRQAFHQYGLEPEAATEEMRERGRNSPIRVQLGAALDEWARIISADEVSTLRNVLDFANALDDLAERRAVRTAIKEMDRTQMLQLSKQPDLALLTLPTMILLAKTMACAGDPLPAEEMLHRLPNESLAQLTLGSILAAQSRFTGAETAFRESIRLRPAGTAARYLLGVVLLGQNKQAEAETVFRELLHLDSKHVGAWSNLTCSLAIQKRIADAEGVNREGLRSLPDSAQLHCGLGNILAIKKQFVEAEASFRDALRLDPSHVPATCLLARLLILKDRWEEAEELLRAATRSKTEAGSHWECLASLLVFKDQYPDAEAALVQSLRLTPTSANTRFNLVGVLEFQGKFEAALAELQKVNILELPDQMGELNCRNRLEKALLLAPRLPAVLHGELKPANPEEALQYAWMCFCQRRSATAVRLYEEAFRSKPQISELLMVFYRSNAAYAAIRAASGSEPDAPAEEAERERLRRQALATLRDLHTEHVKMVDQDKNCHAAVNFLLQGWQHMKGYSSVREPAELGRLSQEEREEWLKYWSDIQALRERLVVEWD